MYDPLVIAAWQTDVQTGLAHGGQRKQRQRRQNIPRFVRNQCYFWWRMGYCDDTWFIGWPRKHKCKFWEWEQASGIAGFWVNIMFLLVMFAHFWKQAKQVLFLWSPWTVPRKPQIQSSWHFRTTPTWPWTSSTATGTTQAKCMSWWKWRQPLHASRTVLSSRQQSQKKCSMKIWRIGEGGAKMYLHSSCRRQL